MAKKKPTQDHGQLHDLTPPKRAKGKKKLLLPTDKFSVTLTRGEISKIVKHVLLERSEIIVQSIRMAGVDSFMSGAFLQQAADLEVIADKLKKEIE